MSSSKSTFPFEFSVLTNFWKFSTGIFTPYSLLSSQKPYDRTASSTRSKLVNSRNVVVNHWWSSKFWFIRVKVWKFWKQMGFQDLFCNYRKKDRTSVLSRFFDKDFVITVKCKEEFDARYILLTGRAFECHRFHYTSRARRKLLLYSVHIQYSLISRYRVRLSGTKCNYQNKKNKQKYFSSVYHIRLKSIRSDKNIENFKYFLLTENSSVHVWPIYNTNFRKRLLSRKGYTAFKMWLLYRFGSMKTEFWCRCQGLQLWRGHQSSNEFADATIDRNSTRLYCFLPKMFHTNNDLDHDIAPQKPLRLKNCFRDAKLSTANCVISIIDCCLVKSPYYF